MLIPKLTEKATIIFRKQQGFWKNDPNKRDMFKVLDFPLKTGSREGLEDVFWGGDGNYY